MKKEINNSFENVEKRASKLPSECTTIIVGEEQSADGAKYLCRSSDFDALMAINIEVHEDTKFGSEEFVAKDSKFRCPLPKEALGYTGLPDYQFPGEWGSAGFNTAGVGMSSTETIFSSDKALAFDPYVKNGLAENCTYNIVLPYVHTAREGAARLGKLIEQYGSAEGFGIGFIDDKEIWYLENACGHKWLACRMPKDQYFVTGNQSRFRDYAPEDKENFMAAPDLIEFAEKNGLYDPNDAEAEKDKHGKAKFDFHKAYSRDEVYGAYSRCSHQPSRMMSPRIPSLSLPRLRIRSRSPTSAPPSVSIMTIPIMIHICMRMEKSLIAQYLSSAPRRPTSSR